MMEVGLVRLIGFCVNLALSGMYNEVPLRDG